MTRTQGHLLGAAIAVGFIGFIAAWSYLGEWLGIGQW